MRLKQNPYHLLLLAGLVLVLTAFLLDKSKTLDIHVHDTYFVIALGHVFMFFALVVWVLWFLYLLTRKILYSRSLTWTHVIFTILILIILLFLLNYGDDISSPGPTRYINYSNGNTFNAYNQGMKWISFATIAFLSGQIIFMVNFIIGMVKRVKYRKPTFFTN